MPRTCFFEGNILRFLIVVLVQPPNDLDLPLLLHIKIIPRHFSYKLLNHPVLIAGSEQ